MLWENVQLIFISKSLTQSNLILCWQKIKDLDAFQQTCLSDQVAKMSQLNFSILSISLIYALLLIDLSGYTEVFSKLVKLTIFDIFNELKNKKMKT